MSSKADRAIRALRECADAMEDMPVKRMNVWFDVPMVNTKILREEADWIERQRNAWEESIVASDGFDDAIKGPLE